MSKKKSKRNSKTRSSTKKQEGERKINKRIPLFSIVLWLCTVLGGIAAAVIFLPRPIVSAPSVPLDQNDIFSVSFDIINGGYVPLEDSCILLGVGQIGTRGAQINSSFTPTFESRLAFAPWQHHRLGMDDKFTIVLTDAIKGQIDFADIAIIVSYKPWFLPIRREKTYRFVSIRQADGRSYWRSWPIEKALPPIH